ncbi:MAG: AbgT family transporter [Paraprevotella sp.]|nr:AbgT family transporter [Paraprevotella sp.]
MAGAMERSGLSAIVRELWKKGRVSLTYRQRRACWMSGIFLLCVVTGTILLMLGPNAILLNVTGHIYPSPFWFGIVLSLFMELMATALVYAALSFHLRGWQECLSGLYWGIQRHAAWLLVAILFSHLYHTLCYVLENVTMGALLYE